MLNDLVGIPSELHNLVNAIAGFSGLFGIGIGWLAKGNSIMLSCPKCGVKPSTEETE